jgi:hypothetical protein
LTEWKSYLYAGYVKKKVKSVKSVKKVKPVRRKRSIKPEAGKISGKAIIGIAVLVIVVAGGAFFFAKSNGSSSSPLNGLVKAPLNANCELKDPDLCKFYNNWQNVKDYSITSTSKDKTGESGDSVFEISGENSHMLVKQNGKDAMEIINIDKTTYTKDYTDNKWWKHTYEPDKNNDLTKDITDKTKFDESKAVEDKTTYKSLGKEACGDLQCFKYQMVSPDDAGSTELIWFDDRDYLLRKQSSTDKEGNTSESVFAYNGVHIAVPAPVKEGSAEQMYAPQMSAEEKAQYEQMKKEAQQQMQSAPQGNDSSAPDTSGSDDSGGY